MQRDGDRSCGLCNMAISHHKEEGNSILTLLEGVSWFKFYQTHHIHDGFYFPLEQGFLLEISPESHAWYYNQVQA
jgi:hypothetical protein